MFYQVTAANGSSSSEVKTAKDASSDERVKITNGGSILRLNLNCIIIYLPIIVKETSTFPPEDKVTYNCLFEPTISAKLKYILFTSM